MQYALRLGRLGSLTIYLNYTWLFAVVLGLWWLALLWLPNHLPGWRGGWYWLTAVLVLVLYFFTLIAHEMIHSAVGRTGPRNAILYPIGAAQPFRLDRIEPGRGVIAAVAAPLFNLVLGGILLLLTTGITPGEIFTDAIKGVLEPLGWLNFALGIINFLPGIPFDGGWAISAGIYWFNGDRESGLALARSVGGLASLAIVLLGAWRGLTTNSWIESLALVLLGWAANDAGTLSRERGLLRGAFSELRTQDLMTPVRPGDSVHEDESIAALVKEHPRMPPGEPIAVVDAEGKMVGLVALNDTEELLQGNWANTPVRAITTSLDESMVLSTESTLNDAIALYEARQAGDDAEELSIPVLQDGRLAGSISPSRLSTFVGMAEQFGVEETLTRNGSMPDGVLRFLGRALPPLIIVALLAILGNIALRTNPAEIGGSIDDTAEAPITFSGFRPANASIVDIGPLTLAVEMSAPSAITTATMTLDGEVLEAIISGESPLMQTLSASLPGITQGLHNVEVKAGLESGRSKRAEWQFRVTAAEPTPEPTIAPTVPPTIEPTQAPSGGAPRFDGQRPAPGARLLAGATQVAIAVTVNSAQPINSAAVQVDGANLPLQIEPVAGIDGEYKVSAVAPKVEAGEHRLRIEVIAGSAVGAIEWTFAAVTPDTNNVYFEQTGQLLYDPFLTYWRANGGLAIMGYPISDRIVETEQSTGERYTAQYFERARFELHAATGDQVILGRLGALIHEIDPTADPILGSQYFTETGHNLGGDFLSYWTINGGLAVFGLPLTEEIIEVSPTDGQEYTVQYFERNRFELHPEAAPGSRVQLGLLGTEIYNKQYGTGVAP